MPPDIDFEQKFRDEFGVDEMEPVAEAGASEPEPEPQPVASTEPEPRYTVEGARIYDRHGRMTHRFGTADEARRVAHLLNRA